jgi:hypothetical protein
MTKKKPVEEQKKKGRKSLYDPDIHPKKAAELALMGLDDAALSSALGISEATLNNWKKQYPEFLEPLKRSKAQADAPVVASLYQRACGYEYTEISEKHDPEKGLIRTVVTKQVAPDVTAQIFWLKNRQPKDWRDKREVDLGNIDGAPLTVKILKGVSMDDL